MVASSIRRSKHNKLFERTMHAIKDSKEKRNAASNIFHRLLQKITNKQNWYYASNNAERLLRVILKHHAWEYTKN